MAEKEIDLRRLVIKAFHMTDVEWGEHNNITTDGHMTVSKEMIDQLVAQDDCIEKIDIQIIKPGDHDRWTNTIMDIIPISTKVLGKLGEGITHTITGVYVMLTGVDVNGKQCHEFGSSEGNLKEQLYLNREMMIISFLLMLHLRPEWDRRDMDHLLRTNCVMNLFRHTGIN